MPGTDVSEHEMNREKIYQAPKRKLSKCMEISNCVLATAYKQREKSTNKSTKKKLWKILALLRYSLPVGSDCQCEYCNNQSCAVTSCQQLPFEIFLKTCTLNAWQLSHLYIEAYCTYTVHNSHAHSLCFRFHVYERSVFTRPNPERKSISTLYRKSDLYIPKNETARPRSQFLHSCICERFIYSQDRSSYLAAAK